MTPPLPATAPVVSPYPQTIRVLFDQQIMAQRYGGVSRYVMSLIRALNERTDVRAQLAALAHINAYIGHDDALHPLSFGLEHPKRGTRFRARLMEPLFTLACALSRPDIVHETWYMRQAEARARRAAFVTTWHDMALETFPAYFERAAQQVQERRLALRRADAIICISHHTRSDLLAHYPELEDRTHVVWHGVDQTVSRTPRPAFLPKPYLLYVGTRGAYKNFAGLVQALGSSQVLSKGFDLVCFGGGVLQADDHATAKSAGFHGRLVHMSGSDAELANMYLHARAFVFPSIYEGFGMPLTEAMVQSCPIVCSRASSFPEVAGEAATYFDPHDVDSMRHAIEAVALDDACRQEMSTRAGARAALFSWARCAEQTSAVYRSALEHASGRAKRH